MDEADGVPLCIPIMPMSIRAAKAAPSAQGSMNGDLTGPGSKGYVRPWDGLMRGTPSFVSTHGSCSFWSNGKYFSIL